MLLHMVLGRSPTPPPPVWPPIYKREIDAVADWLHGNAQRRPVQTAKVLVQLVKFRLIGMPLPPRQQIADRLKVSMPLLDKGMAKWQDDGLIWIDYRRQDGATSRYVTPCDELITIVRNAKPRRRR